MLFLFSIRLDMPGPGFGRCIGPGLPLRLTRRTNPSPFLRCDLPFVAGLFAFFLSFFAPFFFKMFLLVFVLLLIFVLRRGLLLRALPLGLCSSSSLPCPFNPYVGLQLLARGEHRKRNNNPPLFLFSSVFLLFLLFLLKIIRMWIQPFFSLSFF